MSRVYRWKNASLSRGWGGFLSYFSLLESLRCVLNCRDKRPLDVTQKQQIALLIRNRQTFHLPFTLAQFLLGDSCTLTFYNAIKYDILCLPWSQKVSVGGRNEGEQETVFMNAYFSSSAIYSYRARTSSSHWCSLALRKPWDRPRPRL